MNVIRFGSVCSGIEAASVAWSTLGWRAAWFAEIEAFPSAVLAYHWPHVQNLGDMTKIRDNIATGDVEAPDILVGGTPCQAFSVAGARNSLDDERGQLSLEYVRLLNEIDAMRSTRNEQPAIAVWENVPGVLNTKDNAFGCFLGALAGEECELQPSGGRWTNAGCVFGSQRTVAWRILDAQYFGLAQRRRRMFVVASAREGFNPTEVLFEWEGLRRDTPPSRTQAQNPSGISGRNLDDTSWERDDENIINNECYCLQGNMIGRSLNAGPQGSGISDNLCYTLTTGDRHAVAIDKDGNKFAYYLTPVECERLQGFPDNHTLIPYRNKPKEQCPDGPRYAACGNTMAVPVMRWLGMRIKMVLESKPYEPQDKLILTQ